MSSSTKSAFGTLVGAALLSAAIAPAASASVNPFQAESLTSGYGLVNYDKHEGEGKCGEGKCGEGKCGDKKPEGKCGEKKPEGKCGEGKCGGAS